MTQSHAAARREMAVRKSVLVIWPTRRAHSASNITSTVACHASRALRCVSPVATRRLTVRSMMRAGVALWRVTLGSHRNWNSVLRLGAARFGRSSHAQQRPGGDPQWRH